MFQPWIVHTHTHHETQLAPYIPAQYRYFASNYLKCGVRRSPRCAQLLGEGFLPGLAVNSGLDC